MSSEGNFTRDTTTLNYWNKLENYTCKISYFIQISQGAINFGLRTSGVNGNATAHNKESRIQQSITMKHKMTKPLYVWDHSQNIRHRLFYFTEEHDQLTNGSSVVLACNLPMAFRKQTYVHPNIPLVYNAQNAVYLYIQMVKLVHKNKVYK